MEKNTKILLGVGALAAVGYYMWMKSSTQNPVVTTPKASFVGADGKKDNKTCTFTMNGEVLKGKISEIDSKYCFTTDGKRGLAI